MSAAMENPPGETAPVETTTAVVSSGAFGRLVRTVMVSIDVIYFIKFYRHKDSKDNFFCKTRTDCSQAQCRAYVKKMRGAEFCKLSNCVGNRPRKKRRMCETGWAKKRDHYV